MNRFKHIYTRYKSLPQSLRTTLWLTVPTITLITTLSIIEHNKQRIERSQYYEFFPGSTDEILSHTLKTGDIVMFNHRIVDTKCTKILLNILNKFIHKSSYDHIGVIVYDTVNDRPMVLEHNYNGITLTNYDERILLSRCSEIDLKRLSVDYHCTDEQQAAVNTYIHQLLQQQTQQSYYNRVLQTTWRLIKYGTIDYFSNLSLKSKRHSSTNYVELITKKFDAVYYMYELQQRIDKLKQHYTQQCTTQQHDDNCNSIYSKLSRLQNQLDRAELQTKQLNNKLTQWLENNTLDNVNVKYSNVALVTQVLQMINVIPTAYNDVNSAYNNTSKQFCFTDIDKNNNSTAYNKYCLNTETDIPYVAQYNASHYVNGTIPLIPGVHYQRSLPIVTPYKSNQRK